MKKQVIHISVLQSSKIATALYFLLGFIYTIIGIPVDPTQMAVRVAMAERARRK